MNFPGINARVLQERRQRMENRKNLLYEDQLQKMLREIDQACQSPTAKDRLLFTIPSIVGGEPFYEFEECKKFLKTKIREKGFYCRLMIPGNILFVSWNPKLTGALPEDDSQSDNGVIGSKVSGSGSGSGSGGSQYIEVELDSDDPRWQQLFGNELNRFPSKRY